MRRSAFLALVAIAALVAGCDGGSYIGETGAGGGGGGGTGTAAADSLTVIASSAAIASNATDPSSGVAGVTLTAIVVDVNNNAVADAPVVFSAALPASSTRSGAPAALLVGGSTVTNASGTATATLYTGGNATLGVIEVTATVGSLSKTLQITVISPTTTGGGGVITAENMTIVASNTQLASDASNPSDGVEITAILTDSNFVAVPGVQVIFATTSGQLIVSNGVTDNNGQVKATLTTGGDPTIRTITVTTTAPRTSGGTVSRSQDITVVTGASGAAVAFMTLLADSSTLPADAAAAADGVTLTVTALDSTRNTISNVNVAFSADKGAIQVVNGVTNASGQATAILTTGGDATLGPINVTATIGTLSRTLQIQQVAAANPDVQIGTLSGSTFTTGAIAVGASPISAGGSSALRVDIVDRNSGDAPYVGTNVTLTFNSTCVGSGLAQILGSPVTTSTGVANVTYIDKGCGGTGASGNTDTIFVTTEIDGVPLSAQGAIVVNPTSIGSLQFVSATPSIIGLKGSGQPETAVVVFKLLNSSGGPIVGQTVNFSLNTTVGGITLGTGGSPTDSAQTDASGLVQTQVNAGTVHTSVRVTATTTQGSNSFTTQSARLVISAGNPDQNSFSLSVECFNVEALNIDGVTVPVNLYAADHFNNPVPDGTAIAFTTEGGAIQDSCETVNGTCTVNWISQNPRPVSYGTADNGPRAGRSTIMATALGEESFIDQNGNGLFEDGEFSPSNDLPEAFLDNNEDGIWDMGLEEFLDFDEDGTYDFADGFYNGTLCAAGSALCNDGSNTIPKSLHVREQQVIIMSASRPTLDSGDITGPLVSNTFTVAVDAVEFVTFVVRDINDQPMPSGTSIALTASGDGGTVEGTNTYVVPCQTDDSTAGNAYTFALKGASAPGSGTVTLTVTSPGNLATIYQFGLNTF